MPLCECGHPWGWHASTEPYDDPRRPCTAIDCRCGNYDGTRPASSPTPPDAPTPEQLAALNELFVWEALPERVTSHGVLTEPRLAALASLLRAYEGMQAAVEMLRLYRAPCWEFEPEDGDGGLPRVDWLAALLSDVNAWLRDYPQIVDDHADADALREGIDAVQSLHAGLREAIKSERAARASAPDSEAKDA